MIKPSFIKKMPVVILMFVLFQGISMGAISSMEEAVNKAGRQRMLTQKMLKEYALIGMKNSYANPKKSLPMSVKLFDKQLAELQAYVKSPAAAKSLKEVKVLWTPIKKVVLSKPEKSKIATLQRDLEALLKAAHKSTLLITKASKSKAGEIVNTSGRQRMLSQRMAGLYMLKVWGVRDSEFENKLATAMKEFTAAHKKLLASPLSTAEITKHLQKVGKSYMFFKVMGQSKSKKYIPSLINRSANNILKEMNTVTGLYVKGRK